MKANNLKISDTFCEKLKTNEHSVISLSRIVCHNARTQPPSTTLNAINDSLTRSLPALCPSP